MFSPLAKGHSSFNRGGLTIYKSLGMAAQDLVAANLVLKKLNQKSHKIGENFHFEYVQEDDINLLKVSEAEAEQISKHATSELITPRVTLTLKSFCLKEKFLVCEITTFETSSKLTITASTIVYNANEGKLLGIIESKNFHNENLGTKIMTLNNMFDE
jgi:hypothetical protein